MSNEALFFVLVALDVAFVLLCFRLGRVFLCTAVVANIVFTNMVSSKLVTIFGLDSTVANVFYAAIFLATDLLNEYYGRKVARQAVWMGFLALIPIIAFAPFVRMFEPVPYALPPSEAIGVLFDLTPRIAAASIIAYLASNLFDVWSFKKIRDRLPGRKWLWLRKNGSTFMSQGIDQMVFVTLAFAATVPGNTFWQIMLAGYLVKVAVATLDTPMVYAAKWIGLPADLPADPAKE
jgi:queuosine precursor transporter